MFCGKYEKFSKLKIVSDILKKIDFKFLKVKVQNIYKNFDTKNNFFIS